MLQILSMTKSAGYPVQTLEQVPRYSPEIAKNPIHAVTQIAADLAYLHPKKMALLMGIPIGIAIKAHLDKKKKEREMGWR